MIKHIKNNPIMMVSHIADIDGMGSVILARKYYQEKIDYILCEISELDMVLEEDFSGYDIVYICDLDLGENILKKLSLQPELEAKIKHFDHHSTMLGQKVPSYFHAQVELHGRKTCGTELFYEYLLTLPRSAFFKNPFYQEFVEAVREQDTWDFKELEGLAKDLATLLTMLGQEPYMDFILSLHDKEAFQIPSIYNNLLRAQDKVIAHYVDVCDKHLYITEVKGHKVGVIISEQYRSIVGDALSRRHEDIDYILIINFSRMSCSLRTEKETVDLVRIASSFHPDGGGHKKAAAFIIDEISLPIVEALVEGYLKHFE